MWIHRKKTNPGFSLIITVALFVLIGSSCQGVRENEPFSSTGVVSSGAGESLHSSQEATETTDQENAVHTITAEEAKEMMETLDEYMIVDVREQYEYDAGHIEGAVLVPVGSLEELASELLPDKEMTLLLYCRSGNRSAQAANKLLEMGYSNIYDFGGIRDWPYETQTVEAA